MRRWWPETAVLSVAEARAAERLRALDAVSRRAAQRPRGLGLCKVFAGCAPGACEA